MEMRGLLQGGLVEAVQLVLCRTSDAETRGFPLDMWVVVPDPF